MEELKTLVRDGHRLIPLKNGVSGKHPRDLGYDKRDYSIEEIEENIKQGRNVGMMIPQGLVDVDCDWPEVQRLNTSILPLTLGWGRKNEVTHLVYSCEMKEPFDFKLPDVPGAPPISGAHGRTVLQLRTSKGGEPYHAMIPPSVHPDGDTLEWLDTPHGRRLKVEAIDPEDLIRMAGALAGVAVLTRFYPSEGGRDEVVLGLTGCMVRANWPEENIQRFIVFMCRLTGDDEREMRVRKAEASWKRMEAGRSVRGIPATAKLLGIPVEWMREIAIWLGWAKRNPKGEGAVVFCNGVTAKMAAQAWGALDDYQVNGDPGVYAYGESLARVDDGRLHVLNSPALQYELNRCATWLAKDKDGWKATSAPKTVVDDLLSARRSEVTVPALKGVSVVPMFTRDGRLLNRSGFDEGSGISLDLMVDVQVPECPTPREVRRALRHLWEPISQFPFVDRSDRVHALAMILEPFMRDMFGPTPMYFINKPDAGTGASLLLETALYPTLGHWPEAQTPPTSKEEMKKTLTACLAEGLRVIYFDNADVLHSGELASAITAETYAARILGVSKLLKVPVRVQWVGSGNNTMLSGELYRRMIDIRLDAKMANPEDRDISQFRIKDLKAWTVEHRDRQVIAALTIIQHWVNKGMPKGKGSKASIEAWAQKMSGLFDCIGVKGFLETPKDRRPEDPEAEQIRAVIIALWKAQREYEQGRAQYGVDLTKPKATDVLVVLNAMDVQVDLGFKDPSRAMGDLLRKHRGRVFEFETMKGATMRLSLECFDYQNATRWRVKGEREARPEEARLELVDTTPF